MDSPGHAGPLRAHASVPSLLSGLVPRSRGDGAHNWASGWLQRSTPGLWQATLGQGHRWPWQTLLLLRHTAVTSGFSSVPTEAGPGGDS